MPVSLRVTFMSGRAVDLWVDPASHILDLKHQAQQQLGLRGRLLSAASGILHEVLTVAEAGLSSGDVLTLQAQPCTVASTCFRKGPITNDAAFAAILDDGSVVSWGSGRLRPNSSAVQEQLKNVQQVQSTRRAFAAILEDGSIVAGAVTMRAATALQSRSTQESATDPKYLCSICSDSLRMDPL